jgi:hypothetical protein
MNVTRIIILTPDNDNFSFVCRVLLHRALILSGLCVIWGGLIAVFLNFMIPACPALP